MTKYLALTLTILFLLCLNSRTVMAQGADAWIKVSPESEEFTVLMPQSPKSSKQKNVYGDLNTEARVYRVEVGETSYAVWSLKNTNYAKPGSIDTEDYLDSCADLVWESLLKPLRDKLPKKPYPNQRMTYQFGLTDTSLPGREYLIRLDRTEGATHFFVSDERIYVLIVLGASRNAVETDRFLKSFAPTRPVRQQGAANPMDGMGMGPGRAGNTDPGTTNALPGGAADDSDPNKIFTTREVTQKARLLSRPEPGYTERARMYGVTGTVVVRAVFSKEGEVTNMKVVKRLPHGLTRQALIAARGIKFEPAMRSGRNVSQYIQIEYNFNLY
ncbi:MAG: energy transducer TonB [Acidobacteria bacterium]|nr:energy transducer TonB [Acidobacteriota bacterium]